MNVLFLTEAGAGIGLGHITRVKVIESFFKKSNLKTELILFDRNDIDNKGESSWINDLSWMDRVNEFNTVIIDSYLAPISLFEKIRTHFKCIIVLDDYNRITYPVDIIINPNVFFDRIDYSNQTAICKGGKDFVLLRESFWEIKNKNIYIPDSILVVLGGSDYRNLFSKIALLSNQFNDITFVCPEKKSSELIRSTFPQINLKGRLNEKEILDAYLSSEIVISGCGQSLHELAFLNKKTIGINIDIDQDFNQEYYLSNGFLSEKIRWDDYNLLEKVNLAIKNYKQKSFQSNYLDIKPEENLFNYLKLIKQ